jgi:hypothetical protein
MFFTNTNQQKTKKFKQKPLNASTWLTRFATIQTVNSHTAHAETQTPCAHTPRTVSTKCINKPYMLSSLLRSLAHSDKTNNKKPSAKQTAKYPSTAPYSCTAD